MPVAERRRIVLPAGRRNARNPDCGSRQAYVYSQAKFPLPAASRFDRSRSCEGDGQGSFEIEGLDTGRARPITSFPQKRDLYLVLRSWASLHKLSPCFEPLRSLASGAIFWFQPLSKKGKCARGVLTLILLSAGLPPGAPYPTRVYLGARRFFRSPESIHFSL